MWQYDKPPVRDQWPGCLYQWHCVRLRCQTYSIVGWMSHSPRPSHVTHTAINRLHVSTGAAAHKPAQMESSMHVKVSKLSLTPTDLKVHKHLHTCTQGHPTDFTSARFQSSGTCHENWQRSSRWPTWINPLFDYISFKLLRHKYWHGEERVFPLHFPSSFHVLLQLADFREWGLN